MRYLIVVTLVRGDNCSLKEVRDAGVRGAVFSQDGFPGVKDSRVSQGDANRREVRGLFYRVVLPCHVLGACRGLVVPSRAGGYVPSPVLGEWFAVAM